MKNFLSVLFVGLVSFSLGAEAATFPGIQAGLEARDALIEEFVEGRSQPRALEALDGAVDAALDVLAREGEPELAARYRRAWERELDRALRRGFDVGDHEPLSRVLNDVVIKLRQVLGKNSKAESLLADLETLNFTIPVVFAPRGDWRRNDPRRDREEYAEHFIPFSGIVTYYASLTACQRIAANKGLGKLGRKLCPRIADRLEAEMEKRLAPKLADFVFDQANGKRPVRLRLERDYRYVTARDLEAALN